LGRHQSRSINELADLTACRLAHPLSQRTASVADLVKDALKRRQVGHDEMARGLLDVSKGYWITVHTENLIRAGMSSEIG
jgi:hypothetical protein